MSKSNYSRKQTKGRGKRSYQQQQQPIVVVYPDEKQVKQRNAVAWVHLIVGILGLICTAASLYIMTSL